MVQYKIEKRQDKYFLMNTGAISISYKIDRLFNCVDFINIFEDQVLSNAEVEIVFPVDAEYSIIISDGINPIQTVNIKHFLSLENSFITSIFNTLCECSCGCNECNNSTNIECDLLLTRAKIDLYKRLTAPIAEAFFNAVYKQTKCLLEEKIYCNITEEKVYGKATCDTQLTKQLLALDYLALYFFEKKQVCTVEDISFVDNKFKINKIFCCITKLGVDIKEIEQIINNSMGIVTIESAVYANQPPSTVGDITISVGNRAVTILTLPIFTTNTTPPYADPENDPVADLRVNTLPVDGVLKLNGIPVIIGQIIPVVDINNSLFTYESPNQDAFDIDTFDFSLRDTGSLQWTT